MKKVYYIDFNLYKKAFKRVKKNKGKAGIDNVTIEMYEKNLDDNLYKLWNRMSSGSYMAKPIRYCELPKSNGKKRIIGVPTVEDRVAQMVVKMCIDPYIDKDFFDMSCGFRPNKSAKEAIVYCATFTKTNQYVIDLDFEKFFDTVDHDLLFKLVEKNIKEEWCRLYIKRWIVAPFGKLVFGKVKTMKRNLGTPQGGIISPLLANMFLNEFFDMWLLNKGYRFVRYADDSVVFCNSLNDARNLYNELKIEIESKKLKINEEKTNIVALNYDCNVYSKNRFNFLGYTFEGSRYDVNISMSDKNLKKLLNAIESFNVSTEYNEVRSKVFGWVNYYNLYDRTKLKSVLNIMYKKLQDLGMSISCIERIYNDAFEILREENVVQ